MKTQLILPKQRHHARHAEEAIANQSTISEYNADAAGKPPSHHSSPAKGWGQLNLPLGKIEQVTLLTQESRNNPQIEKRVGNFRIIGLLVWLRIVRHSRNDLTKVPCSLNNRRNRLRP